MTPDFEELVWGSLKSQHRTMKRTAKVFVGLWVCWVLFLIVALSSITWAVVHWLAAHS